MPTVRDSIDLSIVATQSGPDEMRPENYAGEPMIGPVFITSDLIDAAGPGIAHGFFTRRGGVSTGIFDSLNIGLGSADDASNVQTNRQMVKSAMGLPDAFLAIPHQTHSADVIEITGAWPNGERPKADGVVTRRAGSIIGVLTADCGPVLFADGRASVIGACHAGWKGALGGILENTIEAMERLGAHREDIGAALGPSISQENYEVGPEFEERFLAEDISSSRFFRDSANTGRKCFDLPGYILSRLERIGVAGKWTGHCTYADTQSFFSYRRTTHRREPDYGRQVSAIALRS